MLRLVGNTKITTVLKKSGLKTSIADHFLHFKKMNSEMVVWITHGAPLTHLWERRNPRQWNRDKKGNLERHHPEGEQNRNGHLDAVFGEFRGPYSFDVE